MNSRHSAQLFYLLAEVEAIIASSNGMEHYFNFHPDYGLIHERFSSILIQHLTLAL